MTHGPVIVSNSRAQPGRESYEIEVLYSELSAVSLTSASIDITSERFDSLENEVAKQSSTFDIEMTTPTLPAAAHLKLSHTKSSETTLPKITNPARAPGHPFMTPTGSMSSDSTRSIHGKNLSLPTPSTKYSLSEKVSP